MNFAWYGVCFAFGLSKHMVAPGKYIGFAPCLKLGSSLFMAFLTNSTIFLDLEALFSLSCSTGFFCAKGFNLPTI